MTEMWKKGFSQKIDIYFLKDLVKLIFFFNLQSMSKKLTFHFWTKPNCKFNYQLSEVWHSVFRQIFLKLWQKNWLFDDRNLEKRI